MRNPLAIFNQSNGQGLITFAKRYCSYKIISSALRYIQQLKADKKHQINNFLYLCHALGFTCELKGNLVKIKNSSRCCKFLMIFYHPLCMIPL